MRFLTIFVLSSLLLLCSCNNNDEPLTETVLPISKYYQPCTSEFNITDTEWLDKIKGGGPIKNLLSMIYLNFPMIL